VTLRVDGRDGGGVNADRFRSWYLRSDCSPSEDVRLDEVGRTVLELEIEWSNVSDTSALEGLGEGGEANSSGFGGSIT
jgi:hypothetical protein